MTKEKKRLIILTIALAVLAFILIVVFAIVELRKNGIIGSKESSEIMEKFNKTFNSKEIEVIYYHSTGCGYCELQAPILELVTEDYDIDYLSVDSTLLGVNERQKVLDALDIEHATPTTVIVKKGKVIDKQVGFVDGKSLVAFFKENGLVPEDAIYSAEKNLNYVSYEEYEDIIGNKGKNIVVIGQTSCSHCIAIKPALNSVAEEYDLTINYLNLTDLTKEESSKFYESLDRIEYDNPDYVNEGKFGTPLTLVIKDGKVYRYISGSRTISQLVREFTKAGLIEE